MLESEADKSFSQSTLQQTSMKKNFHSNDTAIEQREREINDIAKGIIELADIFKNLQAMVIDQGTMLDRIDYNVEKMAVDVQGAQKELVTVCLPRAVTNSTHAVIQATKYQRKYTKRKILFLLLLLVIGMFILLLVKPKRHKALAETPPDPPPLPINDGGIAKPLDEKKPNASPPEALSSPEDGAPFVLRNPRSFRSI